MLGTVFHSNKSACVPVPAWAGRINLCAVEVRVRININEAHGVRVALFED